MKMYKYEDTEDLQKMISFFVESFANFIYFVFFLKFLSECLNMWVYIFKYVMSF